MSKKICVIKGDGIGPEIIDSALAVLKSLNIADELEFVEAKAGYSCYKECGNPIPEETITSCREADAMLFGSVTTPPNIDNYKSPIITLRQTLNLYANIRPIRSWPVKDTRQNINMVIVRENTEGLYSGIEHEQDGGNKIIAERVITKKASENIARAAFELAKRETRKRVTIVHKANVLRKSCGLFLNTCYDVAKNYPDITADDMIVDAMAMHMIKRPEEFDVIVTTNLFGDILSDEASMLTVGLGMACSGNIGDKTALFEPAHGSAPKYEGKNIVNPFATILSAKMMLDYLGYASESRIIEKAIEELIKNNKTTKDLGGALGTKEVTQELIKQIRILKDN